MKLSLFVAIAATLFFSYANAQDNPANAVRYQFIAKDSVRLSLNEDFELVGDSCATIYRYARLDTALGKFIGHIKDVSRANPNLIVTEGTYDKDGNKQGLFVSNFLNGKAASKGGFVNDKFDGKWELYYDSGKPRMNFEVHGNDIQINDYWDINGAKIVSDGRGKYKFETGQIYWEGNLLNGRPAGTWFAYKTGKDEGPIITEIYKLGVFQVGRSPSGKEYKDAARMELVSTDLLPFTHAEALRQSAAGCNVKFSAILQPEYEDGIDAYNKIMSDEVHVALESTDLKRYNNKSFSIVGVVDDKGFLADLKAVDPFDPNITRSLLAALKRLPALRPIVKNGQRVKANFQVDFVVKDGFCQFKYIFTAQ